jgi:multiple sugar transport system substrate-binding protein
MRRRLAFFFVMLLLVILPVSAQDEDIVLRFTVWVGGPFLEMFEEFAADYTEQNPNVTVVFEVIPFDVYSTGVVTQVAGSDPPDIGWVVEVDALQWANAGILADMGPTLDSDPDYNLDDFAEGPMELWTDGDAIYGIPFSTAPFFLVFNRDLFEEAGLETPDLLADRGEWTYEAFRDAARAIVEASPFAYGYMPVYNSLQEGPMGTITPPVRAFGGEFWNEDGTECLMNSEEAVAGLQLLQDMMLVDESMVPLGEEANFALGDIGMTITQLGVLPDYEGVNYGIAPLPSGPAGGADIVGQAAISVYEASTNQEAAIDFVRFITTEEYVTRMAEFFPPARNSVLDSDILLQFYPDIDPDQLRAASIETIRTGRVIPSHLSFAEILQVMRAELDNVWSGSDIQEAMDSVCENIEPFLND